MNLVLLPGNSLSNKTWIKEVEEVIKPHFEKTVILNYQHWDTEEELIDLDKETIALTDVTKDLKDYLIFAKSAGCLLALRGIYEGKINPVKCIFVGSAISWGEYQGFPVDEWLKNFATPTLFIQKTADPAISFSDLKQLLSELNVKNYQLVEIPGNNHHYENIELLKELTLKFT